LPFHLTDGPTIVVGTTEQPNLGSFGKDGQSSFLHYIQYHRIVKENMVDYWRKSIFTGYKV